MHDPRVGRFFAVDPLAAKYPYYTPYSFSGNTVINSIELEGLEPGVLFSTPEDAANDFGKLFNDNSIRDDKEYGTKIYKITQENTTKYSYSIPVVGSSHGISNKKMNSIDIPSGGTWVAWAHTHGAESGPQYADNRFSGKPGSIDDGGDIAWSEWKKKDAFVATPDGSLDKYDISLDKIIEINTSQPTDTGSGTGGPGKAEKSTSNYTIKQGDTLSSIAERYHTTVSAIASENNISDVNKITAGSSINITN